MNLRNGNDRKSLLSLVFLVAAVVMMVLTGAEAIKILQAPDQTGQLFQVTLDQIRPDEKTAKNCLSRYQQAADQLSRQNSFVPPPSAAPPPSGCTAIFGDAARIGDRWVQVGDKFSDAQVLAVEPTRVVLLWQEREITLAPKLSESNSNRRSSSSSRNQSSNRSRNSSSNRGRGR
jgi:hypothetical protein